MTNVEYIKKICKERKIPISRLERECNFSNGYISSLKNGALPSDRLIIVAKYLDISINEILTSGEKGKIYYIDSEDAKIAQEMFEDKDIRSLYNMKKNMNPDNFKANMDMMKRMYRLEHPELFPEDLYD